MGEKKLDNNEISNNSSDNENRDNVSEIKELLEWYCKDYKDFAEVYNNYSDDKCQKKLKGLVKTKNGIKEVIEKQGKKITGEIGKVIKNAKNIANSYEIKYNRPIGNFARSPWIAIPKSGEEGLSEIQKGIYLVYLFDTEEKRVFLTLSIGSQNTERIVDKLNLIKNLKKIPGGFTKNENFSEKFPLLCEHALKDTQALDVIKDKIKEKKDLEKDKLSFLTTYGGSKDYYEGLVLYREYSISDSSKFNKDNLKEDLEAMIAFFDKNLDLFKSFYNGSTPPNSPSNQEDADSYLKTTLKVLEESKALILYGPPGSGKTRLAKIVADKVTTKKENIKLVQFHPSYSYDDFVRGMSIKTDDKNGIKYEIESKIIEKFCDGCTEKNPKVLIIDEINRAPLGSVLGELIYGLEYRDQPISTSYELKDKKTLTIPEGLYIIGTMNTADRSLFSGLCSKKAFCI